MGISSNHRIRHTFSMIADSDLLPMYRLSRWWNCIRELLYSYKFVKTSHSIMYLLQVDLDASLRAFPRRNFERCHLRTIVGLQALTFSLQRVTFYRIQPKFTTSWPFYVSKRTFTLENLAYLRFASCGCSMEDITLIHAVATPTVRRRARKTPCSPGRSGHRPNNTTLVHNQISWNARAHSAALFGATRIAIV